jgi:MATE family multidrug resistance protein
VTFTAWKENWHAEGGGAELLRLAWPLILSNSFWTIQIIIDRILLSRYHADSVAAAIPAVAVYYTPFVLLQYTANYATTFVAQYLGAGRSERIGSAVWQALFFSVLAGVAFLGLIPLAGPIFALSEHSEAVQEQETTYLRTLCFAALPALITAASNSFFAGRGKTKVVMIVDASGVALNALLAYVLIYGRFGFPEMGIAGAGWATVAGSSLAAVLSVALFLHPCHREEFGTLTGARLNRDLFRRLLWFGVPSGLQTALDIFAFTVFVFLVGRLGDAELAASNIAFSINVVAVLPALGVSQAVMVLVGQRLGQDRPDLAERSTWTGLRLCWLFMTGVGLLYVLAPGAFLFCFANQHETDKWEPIAALVPVLLRFVAVYTLFDSVNLVFSFALRGAGDTRFVTVIALLMAWPMMVLPTWAALRYGWGLYWAWAFASSYIIALAVIFLLRFRIGKWKGMRVIETQPAACGIAPVAVDPAPATLTPHRTEISAASDSR